MTQLCWNGTYGPIPANVEYGTWQVIHVRSGHVLDESKIIYVDDENSEIWQFVEPVEFREAGGPTIEKNILGIGKLRLTEV